MRVNPEKLSFMEGKNMQVFAVHSFHFLIFLWSIKGKQTIQSCLCWGSHLNLFKLYSFLVFIYFLVGLLISFWSILVSLWIYCKESSDQFRFWQLALYTVYSCSESLSLWRSAVLIIRLFNRLVQSFMACTKSKKH